MKSKINEFEEKKRIQTAGPNSPDKLKMEYCANSNMQRQYYGLLNKIIINNNHYPSTSRVSNFNLHLTKERVRNKKDMNINSSNTDLEEQKLKKMLQKTREGVSIEEILNEIAYDDTIRNKFQMYCKLQNNKQTTLVPKSKGVKHSKGMKEILCYNKSLFNSNTPCLKNFEKSQFSVKKMQEIISDINTNKNKNQNNCSNFNKSINNNYQNTDSNDKLKIKNIQICPTITPLSPNLKKISKEFFKKDDIYINYIKKKEITEKIMKKVDFNDHHPENSLVIHLDEIMDEIIQYSNWFVSEKYQLYLYEKLSKIVTEIIGKNSENITKKHSSIIELNQLKKSTTGSIDQWDSLWKECEFKSISNNFAKTWEEESKKYIEMVEKIELLEARANKKIKFEHSTKEMIYSKKILNHFNNHIGFFDRIKNSMKKNSTEYLRIKDLESTLFRLEENEKISNKELMEIYHQIWDTIFLYFTSQNYMEGISTCAITFIKQDALRNAATLNDLFINNMDEVELQFYDILIHLLYKHLDQSKEKSLKSIQKIIKIQRIFRKKLGLKKKKNVL